MQRTLRKTIPLHEYSRPKLAGKARLRFDRREQRFLLLYPERGLLLNDTAIEILQCCTGQLTIRTIVNILSTEYPACRCEVISNEVLTFLSRLQSRGLIEA